jgi:protein-ribulosamine 3-kinase
LKEIIKNKIESIVKEKIISEASVSGGCINDARILTTESQSKYFVKINNQHPADMFNKEANGLNEIACSSTIRVPKVIFVNDDFILIEAIFSGKRSQNFSQEFGFNFAKMHKYYGSGFGFYEDNYIGSTLQLNIPSDLEISDWVKFYFNKRLLYQFKLAETKGYTDAIFRKIFGQLENKIDRVLDSDENAPSLLHGDLWSGNYLIDENGNACLIDPAVYYGNREADLAMTKLFGGFDTKFYDSYNEVYPLESGYEYRENIYKLYHVLNHLNLFGIGYYRQTIELIRYYI